jgi:hypothetical protein
LRREAETTIAKHGWTKAAMQQMRKIDSFLKESQRMNSAGSREFYLLPEWLIQLIDSFDSSNAS